MTQPIQTPPNWLKFVVIFLLVLGISFRFVNLGKKVYWEDETMTSMWTAGYGFSIAKEVYNGKEISTEDLQKFQRLNPEKSLLDTVNVLTRSSEHPPLYFILGRLWQQCFGSSVTAMRSLSALFSLLVLPCIYWLCLELFETSMVGRVAVGLAAVSPIFIRYAQEARQYSLWTVVMALSSAALLRAIRHHTKLSWVTYAVTVSLSLYTHLFSGFVFIAHGIYVAVIERFRLTKTSTAYLLASGIGVIAFTPWLWLIATKNPFYIMQWIEQRLPFSNWVKFYINNHSRIFWAGNSPRNWIILGIPIFILVAYSIYFLCRYSGKRVWLFVLTLGVVTELALILPDLTKGGVRALIERYNFPFYVSILLAVAYLLATKITWQSPIWQIIIWRAIAVVLISGAVYSCAIASPAETWWGQFGFTLRASNTINQATSPLVISDDRLTQVLPLNHRLDSKVKLLLVNSSNMPKIPEGYSDVFLFNPSSRLRSTFEEDRNLKIKRVYEIEKQSLWTIKKL